MEKYNYAEHVTQDIINYIEENDVLNSRTCETFQEYLDLLADELWDVDEVTGNGIDGYDTEEKCEEYICHNLDLFLQVASEWDIPVISRHDHPEWFEHPAKYMDATIRCYLLYDCIIEALEKLGVKDD